MNFFEHQEQARTRSAKLVWLYALAVLGIIVSIYLVAVVALNFSGGSQDAGSQVSQQTQAFSLWQPQVAAFVGIGVLILVGGGSLFKISQLSGGGAVVARSLGGRLLDPSTRDPDERKLLNIVEEMSLASGVPVPPTYVMEEAGINAFAAGYKPEDAVLGVTRGAIQQLNRDELQGVIAHEYSHVFNGDMRLNIRLIGVIFGILMISQIGEVMMRSAFYGSLFGGGRRRDKNEGGAAMAFIAIGIALMIIGFIGVFFGNLIKAAVSRQREYLADASAVQFTRNPDGIANALKKLGGLDIGGRLRSPHASEFSHMYFAEGVSNMFGEGLATHPSLDKRIRAIDKNWDGKFTPTPTPGRGSSQASTLGGSAAMAGFAGAGAGAEAAAPVGASVAERIQAARSRLDSGQGFEDAAPAVTQIGTVDPEHIAYAQALLLAIPETLREGSHEHAGAMGIVCGLLFSQDGKVQKKQASAVSMQLGSDVLQQVKLLKRDLAMLKPQCRLPLLDLCVGTLRGLPEARQAKLLETVNELVHADQTIDLFEWVTRWVLWRRLGAATQKPSREGRGLKLSQAPSAINTVLTALAYAGARDLEGAANAHALGAQAVGLKLELLPPDQAGISKLEPALEALSQLSPKGKQRLIQALAQTVSADGRVTLMEGELMRAMAEAVDVPMPPILPGQRL